jgi:cbb3-type cytochrome c oxidase subunit III
MRLFVSGLVLALGLTGTANLVQAAGNASEGQAKTAVCAGCHGADGNSAVPNFPKLAGQGERYLTKQISDIKAGHRQVVEMTGMTDGLSEQDIENIAAFFASQPATTGMAKPETVEDGKRLFRAGNAAKGIPACTGCHAPNGKGNAPAGFPLIAGQHATYVESQLKKFQSGERAYDTNSNMMRDIAANLSDTEMKALANYISGLY